MSAQELLTAAQNMRGLIESEADAIEANSAMSEPVVAALAEAGLFRLMVPKVLGGFEADIATIIDVSEAIAYADGSVGWGYCQNCTVMAYSAYLDADHGQQVASSRAAGGMFAPLGTAEKVDGGYRVSGNYLFGSGSGHAQYMGGAALVMENGEMIFDGELPEMISYIVPAEKINLKGNWDVMGLRGTGSYDFEVPEQVVSTGQTFPLFTTTPVNGGSFYGLGPIPIGTVNSVGWALGVGTRALDEIREIARNGRARLGVLPLREQQIFQRDLGLHSTAVASARALAKASYTRAVEGIEQGLDGEDIQRRILETKAAANYAVKVAKEAATFAWEASGSAGMRNPNRLQRCFRDLCVGSGHQVFDQRNYIELVKEGLGLEASPF
jgi:alkylation response protein AidB-like acyl-CoA dehydrogenase